MSRRRRDEVVCEADCACECGSCNEDGPKFYIDEKKQTVVCIFTGNENDASSFMRKLFEENGLYVSSYRMRKGLQISDKFIGKAKCSGGDVFDVEIGKSIAMSKAKVKYYRAMQSVIERFYTRFLVNESTIEDKIESKLRRLDKLKWDHVGNLNKYRDESNKIAFYGDEAPSYYYDSDDINDLCEDQPEVAEKVKALKFTIDSIEEYKERVKNANKLFDEVCRILGYDPEDIRKAAGEEDDKNEEEHVELPDESIDDAFKEACDALGYKPEDIVYKSEDEDDKLTEGDDTNGSEEKQDA